QRRKADVAAFNATHPHTKRAVAMTPVKFGISFNLTSFNQAGALVHVYKDGSVLINHGGAEMGQGLHTKMIQVAATALGVPLEFVRLAPTRTDKVPNTSATAASSGADLNGMAASIAAEKIKRRLDGFAATDPGSAGWSFSELCRRAHLARIQLSATGFYATPKIHYDREAHRGRPFLYFAYGASLSEVAIDTLTGEHRVVAVDILHDVGRSLNPAIDLGQIEGGFIQGMGWLTIEELVFDERGRLLTHAPSTYKIPTAGDRPPHMNIRLWARGENVEETIHRSKAVGEPPLMLAISVFSALTQAVAAAAPGKGLPKLDAPATPERILAAITELRVRDG
ncbi:MAG TPA: molybdopterin cofactor-binding domain-containing protein, partial [Allosphingosinicella sp.]|nr:molybdopterin cofactor-binding domain-containing protein [Allosphingosinicella sp.]